jgi:DNA-directed RNA polymerase specialized sigma24 family protein
MTAAITPFPGSPAFAPSFSVWRDSEWPDVLEGIRMADAGAAPDLYRCYADLIRNTLRRYSGCDEIEDSVLLVFINTLRRVRFCDLRTRREFEQALENLAREEALVLRHRDIYNGQIPELALYRKGELVNSVLTRLDGTERDIVLRSYMLQQRGTDIAADLAIAVNEVERAQAKARRLYQSFQTREQ